jgi:hypothetical protein
MQTQQKTLLGAQILVLIVLCGAHGTQSGDAMRFESSKVLVGGRISLECPQSDPTWFFRGRDSDRENIVVTRYGVVNVDYKNRIFCDSVLNHKLIMVNKADFDDEGTYTCLYTISSENESENSRDVEQVFTLQQRHAFNVSVYSESCF